MTDYFSKVANLTTKVTQVMVDPIVFLFLCCRGWQYILSCQDYDYVCHKIQTLTYTTVSKAIDMPSKGRLYKTSSFHDVKS